MTDIRVDARYNDPVATRARDQTRPKMFRQYSIIAQTSGICNLFVKFEAVRPSPPGAQQLPIC